MSGARGEGPEAGAGGAGGRAAPENPGGVLSLELPGLLAQLARSFALLLPVYALGYLGLSFSWVLLALALLAWCRRSRGLKALRLCRALALLEDEERAVRLGVRACDLPAWVSADPCPPRPLAPGPDPSSSRQALPFPRPAAWASADPSPAPTPAFVVPHPPRSRQALPSRLGDCRPQPRPPALFLRPASLGDCRHRPAPTPSPDSQRVHAGAPLPATCPLGRVQTPAPPQPPAHSLPTCPPGAAALRSRPSPECSVPSRPPSRASPVSASPPAQAPGPGRVCPRCPARLSGDSSSQSPLPSPGLRTPSASGRYRAWRPLFGRGAAGTRASFWCRPRGLLRGLSGRFGSQSAQRDSRAPSQRPAGLEMLQVASAFPALGLKKM